MLIIFPGVPFEAREFHGLCRCLHYLSLPMMLSLFVFLSQPLRPVTQDPRPSGANRRAEAAEAAEAAEIPRSALKFCVSVCPFLCLGYSWV